MSLFKFEIGQVVKMVESDETGKVIGRAEYLNDENNYYVRYKAADGCQRIGWWSESHIEAV